MAEEDEDYDPDAAVPLWVNVVVPITIFIVFVLVLVWLFFTDKEVSADTIERWLQKIGLAKEGTLENDNSLDKSQTQVERPNESGRSSRANSFNGRPTTTGRVESPAESRDICDEQISHITSYGSIISDLSSSCYGGHTNKAYCYESNV